MTDELNVKATTRIAAKIITSYVAHHHITANELANLIAAVDQALQGLGEPAAGTEVRTPAVPVRRSVQREYVVCLECGFRGKTIGRHIATRHGLALDEYRARWSLSPDHPLIAPAYSESRSVMAKQLGLGRRRPPQE